MLRTKLNKPIKVCLWALALVCSTISFHSKLEKHGKQCDSAHFYQPLIIEPFMDQKASHPNIKNMSQDPISRITRVSMIPYITIKKLPLTVFKRSPSQF